MPILSAGSTPTRPRYGGLRGSSDRLRALDGWGLQTTRRLLSGVPPPEPFAVDAVCGTVRPRHAGASAGGWPVAGPVRKVVGWWRA